MTDKPIDRPLEWVGTYQIMGVRVAEIDGRPRLMIAIKNLTTLEIHETELSRDEARELTRTFGRNPIVERFFRGGGGLQ